MPSPRRGRPEGSPAWSAQRRGTLGFRRAEAVSPRSGRSTPARFAEPFPKLPVPGVDHPLRGFAFSDAVPRVPPRNKRSASPWATIGRPHPRAERSQRKAKRQSRRSRRHIVAHSVSCGFAFRTREARVVGDIDVLTYVARIRGLCFNPVRTHSSRCGLQYAASFAG